MGGFFGPTQDFDDFIDQYMTPVMAECGFTCAKRVYQLQRDGASVVVHARLYSPTPTVTFVVEWAAAPAVLRDFFKASRPRWRPSMNMDGMIFARLGGGSQLCGSTEDTDFRFVDPRIELPPGYDDLVAKTVTIDEFGPRFLDYLRATAVPKWHRALTVDYLRTANEVDGDLGVPTHPGLYNDAWRYGSPAAVQAILGVDKLPRDEAEAAIAQFPRSDDPIVPWLRARLDRRS